MSTSPQPAQKGRLPLLRWLRQGRYGAILGFALLCFLISGSASIRNLDTMRRVEGVAHDSHFRLRGNLGPSPQIAIVGITSSSLDQKALEGYAKQSEAVRLMHDNTWPWPRPTHAKVIERLFELGAKTVAVDIGLPSEREGDEELVATLKKYTGRVVLASIVQRGVDEHGATTVNFFHPHPRFTEALGSGSSGLALYAPELDSVTRRFDFRTSELRELNIEDDSRDLTHFAVRAVEIYTGTTQPDRYHDILDYTGKPHTYDYLPVEEIFIDRILHGAGPRYAGGEILRGKLVFYGPIAEIMHDVHATPFGIMPGVEIHSQLAAALLDNRRIADVSPLTSAALAFAAAIGSGLIVLLLRNPLAQIAALAAYLGLVFGVTQIAFSRGNLLFPTVPWLFGALGAGGFGVIYLFFLEQWEKAHTRKVLNRFVSKRIAAVVLKNAEEFEHARRGEKRPVAVFFSDIRSFTTWSENAAPENLVGQLNEYFERAVTHIEEREGNVQKFIGDAILAAWGDTHSNGFADDATRAVATALTMRVTLRALNAGWDKREDRIVISIGMGINHGDVVVGEVGHPERREYTVLGDGVNFAARLESATKQFHTDCLVGESVEVLTRDRFVYRHADFVRVKGKNKPVNIFIPLSDLTIPPPEWLADYHKARALYVERKFTEAAALFRAVNVRIGGEDYLCETYATRCDRYAQEPPPADWDGSYTLTEK